MFFSVQKQDEEAFFFLSKC